ncbi:DUF4296 domain-containing protein [candidate division KSB1 bacterium]|nr:DUF4296 domain-containing protein [candidate division KSB1 bacterium]
MKAWRMMTVFLFSLLSLTACQKKNQIRENEIDQFVAVYTEYLEIITSDTSKTENSDLYMQQILNKHKMSKAEFDATIQHLLQNPESMNTMLEKILPLLNPNDPSIGN